MNPASKLLASNGLAGAGLLSNAVENRSLSGFDSVSFFYSYTDAPLESVTSYHLLKSPNSSSLSSFGFSSPQLRSVTTFWLESLTRLRSIKSGALKLGTANFWLSLCDLAKFGC